MRLYLIGLPGSGKSTIGKELAEKIGYSFIDMDEYIAKEATMFIDEIFEAYGEEYFRALETNVLKEFLNLDNVIIATGGGIVKNYRNKKYMDGVCIYLDAPTDIIQNRCDESNIVRPLLASNTVYMLYLQRKDMYEKFADIKVLNLEKNTCIEDILCKLKEYN